MTALGLTFLALTAIAVAAWSAYRLLLRRSFVVTGRGVLDNARRVEVMHAGCARHTLDFDGNVVEAGPDHAYVLIDVRIDAAAGAVDFDDFQLVKERAAKLGEEENLGDNADHNYFFWHPLDQAGNEVKEVPASACPFRARIAFKVPRDVSSGFLFYWGLYWGPMDFGS